MGGIQSLSLQDRYTPATAWWGQDVGALSSRSCWITRVYTCKKHTENYGKTVFLMGKSSISMAIFNSYVKLPEDNKWPSAGDWWNGTGDWSWWSGRHLIVTKIRRPGRFCKTSRVQAQLWAVTTWLHQGRRADLVRVLLRFCNVKSISLEWPKIH